MILADTGSVDYTFGIMKLAEVTILFSLFVNLCGAAALVIFGPAASRALLALLGLSSALSLGAAIALGLRRNSLERAAEEAARIDLPLAAAVVAAVPRETEIATLTAIDTLNILRARCLSAGDSCGEAGETLPDLDRILEALQFQDMTRQMLESAVAMLEGAGQRLSERSRAVRSPTSEKKLNERFEKTRKALVARAKTNAEKDALMEVRL